MLASALGGYTSALLAQDRRRRTPRPKSTKTARQTRKPPREEPVWPVQRPDPLPGAILPAKRIVAFYGNPLSKRMGILGELPPDEMLAQARSRGRGVERRRSVDARAAGAASHRRRRAGMRRDATGSTARAWTAR